MPRYRDSPEKTTRSGKVKRRSWLRKIGSGILCVSSVDIVSARWRGPWFGLVGTGAKNGRQHRLAANPTAQEMVGAIRDGHHSTGRALESFGRLSDGVKIFLHAP